MIQQRSFESNLGELASPGVKNSSGLVHAPVNAVHFVRVAMVVVQILLTEQLQHRLHRLGTVNTQHHSVMQCDAYDAGQAWAHEIFIFRTEENLKFQDIFQDIRVTKKRVFCHLRRI